MEHFVLIFTNSKSSAIRIEFEEIHLFPDKKFNLFPDKKFNDEITDRTEVHPTRMAIMHSANVTARGLPAARIVPGARWTCEAVEDATFRPGKKEGNSNHKRYP